MRTSLTLEVWCPPRARVDLSWTHRVSTFLAESDQNVKLPRQRVSCVFSLPGQRCFIVVFFAKWVRRFDLYGLYSFLVEAAKCSLDSHHTDMLLLGRPRGIGLPQSDCRPRAASSALGREIPFQVHEGRLFKIYPSLSIHSLGLQFPRAAL